MRLCACACLFVCIIVCVCHRQRRVAADVRRRRPMQSRLSRQFHALPNARAASSLCKFVLLLFLLKLISRSLFRFLSLPLSLRSQMSLTKKDPSLRVAASDPHLVSLGGGRLSTAVTIHYIHVGEYNLPRLQLTRAAHQGRQQLQVALIKMSNKRDLTNVRENSKWNLSKKKLKLKLKLKRTKKRNNKHNFLVYFSSHCVVCVCVMSRCVCVCV